MQLARKCGLKGVQFRVNHRKYRLQAARKCGLKGVDVTKTPVADSCNPHKCGLKLRIHYFRVLFLKEAEVQIY